MESLGDYRTSLTDIADDFQQCISRAVYLTRWKPPSCLRHRKINQDLLLLDNTAGVNMVRFLQALAILPVLAPFALTFANQQNGRSKPNFVFILTDDQDLHLNSMDYMPLTQKHLAEKGTTFERHYCTIAVCCPARVALWTGKYAHNTVSEPRNGFASIR